MIKSFITEDGIEVPAITTEQMREVDRIAMEETGPNLFQMMENAGRNLALLGMEMMGANWKEACFLILAGTGGNGGGGICAARHLANRGLDVFICLTNSDKLSEVTAFQQHIYQATSGKEISLEKLGNVIPDIVLDAIIGYSLKSAPRGAALEMIRWVNEMSTLKLSLDVPSGVDSTTGESAGEFIKATQTMTLALPKTGLLPEKTGTLLLADIGIPAAVYHRMKLEYNSPFGPRFYVPLQKHILG
jgi:NAD(P)H-hydrate epimerase